MNLRSEIRVSELIRRHIRVDTTSTGREKDGREIFTAVCDLCGSVLRNARDSRKHMEQRHYQLLMDENQSSLHAFFGGDGDQASDKDDDSGADVVTPVPSSVIDEKILTLIRLVCRVGLPLSTLKSKHWRDFLAYFGSPVVIKPTRLRSLLLIHAQEIKRRNFEAVKQKYVSIITDGGTITDREFYIVLLFVEGMIYFGGALHVEKTSHTEIARALRD